MKVGKFAILSKLAFYFYFIISAPSPLPSTRRPPLYFLSRGYRDAYREGVAFYITHTDSMIDSSSWCLFVLHKKYKIVLPVHRLFDGRCLLTLYKKGTYSQY
jgi:hypothetical protein